MVAETLCNYVFDSVLRRVLIKFISNLTCWFYDCVSNRCEEHFRQLNLICNDYRGNLQIKPSFPFLMFCTAEQICPSFLLSFAAVKSHNCYSDTNSFREFGK